LFFPPRKSIRSVGRSGADADAVLCGVAEHNQGIRLRVMQAQAKGNEGPLQGSFVLLDVGNNRHSSILEPLLNQTTDATQVVTLLRQKHPNCVNVVNANSLVLESEVAAHREGG
jgi:hypothetical protein